MQLNQFLANMTELYKPALNAAQINFYAGFLHKFTDNQLDELWSITMETHLRTSPPTIGELKKYAAGVTPVKVVNPKLLEQSAWKNLTDEEIFGTELGGLALKQGWACSYREECYRGGIPSQGDDVLLEFQKAQQRMRTELSDIAQFPTAMTKSLINAHQSRLDKNAGLKQRYSHLVAVI